MKDSQTKTHPHALSLVTDRDTKQKHKTTNLAFPVFIEKQRNKVAHRRSWHATISGQVKRFKANIK